MYVVWAFVDRFGKLFQGSISDSGRGGPTTARFGVPFVKPISSLQQCAFTSLGKPGFHPLP